MVGGVDIVIELPGVAPAATLPAAVRYVLDRWPAAVMQDGDTGRLFDGFASMDLVEDVGSASILAFHSDEVWDLAVLRLVGLAKADDQPEMSGFYPLFLPPPSIGPAS